MNETKMEVDPSLYCPKCGSVDMIRNGFDRGRQRWHCKSCDYNATEGARQRTSPQCPRCQSVRTKWDGKYNKEGVRAAKCRDCKKRFPKVL